MQALHYICFGEDFQFLKTCDKAQGNNKLGKKWVKLSKKNHVFLNVRQDFLYQTRSLTEKYQTYFSSSNKLVIRGFGDTRLCKCDSYVSKLSKAK